VIGYEVLADDPDVPRASARSSARALLQAFTDVELDLVAPHHPAYVTMGPGLLVRLDLLPVAPDRVVLQLDDVPTHGDVLAAVDRLAALGYVFAALDPASPEALGALPAVGLVRLDVRGLGPGDVAACIAPFVAADLCVHAVGVDSRDAFQACVAAGAMGLQGAFRALPEIEPCASGSPIALTTAAELLAPDLDAARLEDLITRDLGMSYRLLRYANSALFSTPCEVGTVGEAVTLLGERMTRRWALVVALAASGTGRPDGLLVDALVRARTMELLAADLPHLRADHAFTVGLFSLLPSLVDRPMERALGGLGLPAELQLALLDGHPPYGDLLDQMVCHLDGAACGETGPAGLPRLEAAHRAALEWVQRLRGEIAPASVRLGG
jgi:EAL and modified HD-GYP domain-containing signal transduction protein